MATQETELRGAEKKEAFFQAAEEGVHRFRFQVPDVEAPAGRINCYLAKTDTCSSTILVLEPGYKAGHHYHPNQDGIWVVLKGQVRFFGGADEKEMGVFGPYEGIKQPENTRYGFEVVGEEEAWLMQIAGYPKGKAMAKRIYTDGDPIGEGGTRVDMAVD
ncbi:MAG: cupin domain-containing protein [Alphaproteobacteria bacterium]|nr:cupin domain-containing protein [Alphaproteobacteria bacterium]